MSNPAPLGTLINRRTPYCHAAVPFVMLWSQKSGCTTLLKWFLWHAGLLDEANQYRVEEEGLSIHNYEMEVFKKAPGYRRDLIARLEDSAPIINFMRCPYSRAFSSYMHLHNRFYIRFERDGIRNEGLSLRYAVLQSVYGNRVPVEYPVSFLDYLQWLDGQDLSQLEPHHGQQKTPLYDLPDVAHYRLEDIDTALSQVEQQFQLADSTAVRAGFSSGHHLKKHPLDRAALLQLLERGISLSRSPNYRLPQVDREVLEGTVFGDLIGRIFRDDIALYDSIAA